MTNADLAPVAKKTPAIIRFTTNHPNITKITVSVGVTVLASVISSVISNAIDLKFAPEEPTE